MRAWPRGCLSGGGVVRDERLRPHIRQLDSVGADEGLLLPTRPEQTAEPRTDATRRLRPLSRCPRLPHGAAVGGFGNNPAGRDFLRHDAEHARDPIERVVAIALDKAALEAAELGEDAARRAVDRGEFMWLALLAAAASVCTHALVVLERLGIDRRHCGRRVRAHRHPASAKEVAIGCWGGIARLADEDGEDGLDRDELELLDGDEVLEEDVVA